VTALRETFEESGLFLWDPTLKHFQEQIFAKKVQNHENITYK